MITVSSIHAYYIVGGGDFATSFTHPHPIQLGLYMTLAINVLI
jgi:hypothetical protein